MPLSLRRRQRSKPRKRLSFLPGELVLQMRDDVPGLPGGALGGAGGLGGVAASLPRAVADPLDYLRRNAGLSKVVNLFGDGPMPGTAGAVGGVAASLRRGGSMEGMAGYHLCRLDPKKITPALLKQLQASPAVQLAERVPARFISGGASGGAARRAARAEADPKVNVQWGLRAIRWFDAARPDASAVTVAVIDSGIDAKHPALAPVLADYHYKPFSTTDVLGHGSHVAGVIAASINNGIGIAGVAGCRIEAWKVFADKPGDDGEFYSETEPYLKALREVIAGAARGIKVLNMSLTGEEISAVETALLKRLDAAGITVVASIGNEFEEGNPTYYPAASPTVVAVGAVDEMQHRAVFSNTGAHLALVAPGVSILSTLPLKKSIARDETQYASWEGTSMAAPHVAGAAALYCAQHPEAKPGEVKKALTGSAQKVRKMGAKAFTQEYGRGLLDLKALLG